MTEQALRAAAVAAMRGWLGSVPGSAGHDDILRTYNHHRPLARNYAILPGDAYCAASVSAAWIRAGAASVAPLEVSVPKMTELARKMGIWVEDDGFVPSPGDAVVYDWQDDGKGDNTGRPDHVGLAECVTGGVISVIEGNMGAGHLVGRRSLAVDGRYIRGFITPDYASLCHCQAPEAPRQSASPAALALEVLAGRWGNGEERKRRLTAAGHDYAAVQAEVNRLVRETTCHCQAPEAPRQSESPVALAREVLAGRWGNGEERKRRLAAAGHDYAAVQAEVNRLLKK